MRAVIYIPPGVRLKLTWQGSGDANQLPERTPDVFYQRRRRGDYTAWRNTNVVVLVRQQHLSQESILGVYLLDSPFRAKTNAKH